MFQFLQHKFLHPLKEFVEDSKAIGIVLIACTIVSLLLSNVFIGENYINFFDTIIFNNQLLEQCNSPKAFINEFLMGLFFLVVTLEIKREFFEGELSNRKNATTPIIAAFGGMIMPAIIYYFFTKNTFYTKGWAIPTATDIAFTVGVASMLSKKVPNSLKIFLIALAIIDDLGAIVIIGLFYNSNINWLYLALSIVPIALIVYQNKTQKHSIFLLIICYVLIWNFVLHSGIHSSISGVIFGALMPRKFLSTLQIKLHNWVYFLVLPLFILANTAISLYSDFDWFENKNLIYAIVLGLLIGKPLGIFLFTYLGSIFKLTQLPKNVSMLQFIGASCLAGIGFTMSLFVTQLAFVDTRIQNICKLCVFTASVLAALLGCIILLLSKNKSNEENFT